MDYNINKMCRVCLEEGLLFTSIEQYSEMLNNCSNVKVAKHDGLPYVICNNCIYRLSVAYHFKQQTESSDIRLRNYMGLPCRNYSYCPEQPVIDKETMTEYIKEKKNDSDSEKLDNEKKVKSAKRRYKQKLPEEIKKRGPKPIPKVPKVCYICHKSFKCSAQLQMHIRTHTGEKPFVCNYCPRRFAQKHNLQIHIRTHTNDRPFQCEICSKQFTALGNFQAHKKIHSNIRNQICPVCSKGFITSSDLARHMVIHNGGIKNHHCDTCGKSFTRNRDMVTHKKKIHLNERDGPNYKCIECHKVFPSESCLSIHSRTSHVSTLSTLPVAPMPLFSQGMHPQRLHPF